LSALQENLKLSPAMLSRFDVIFVLLDRPDELMDQALSEHIMALHSGEADVSCCDVTWYTTSCIMLYIT
jgi:DNA helicase MCM8